MKPIAWLLLTGLIATPLAAQELGSGEATSVSKTAPLNGSLKTAKALMDQGSEQYPLVLNYCNISDSRLDRAPPFFSAPKFPLPYHATFEVRTGTYYQTVTFF